MTISAGDRIPEISLTTMTNEGPTPVSFTDLFAGKRVALFAVPGAFTPDYVAYERQETRGRLAIIPFPQQYFANPISR